MLPPWRGCSHCLSGVGDDDWALVLPYWNGEVSLTVFRHDSAVRKLWDLGQQREHTGKVGRGDS